MLRSLQGRLSAALVAGLVALSAAGGAAALTMRGPALVWLAPRPHARGCVLPPAAGSKPFERAFAAARPVGCARG